MTYGCQLWDCTKISNIKIIQRFQNKVLKNIVHSQWYIRIVNLREYLEKEYVYKMIKKLTGSHKQLLRSPVNIEANLNLN